MDILLGCVSILGHNLYSSLIVVEHYILQELIIVPSAVTKKLLGKMISPRYLMELMVIHVVDAHNLT